MNKNISLKEWQSRAQKVLPGAGFGNFDPNISLKRGLGSRVWDEDNKEYIDFLIGSGPMILGHGNEEVLDAIRAQLSEGLTFFTNNSKGIELAEEICNAVKCAEQIRFVSSGGEADMYAMRLARAHTGRNKILKFEGGYHGMNGDSLMSLAPNKMVNFPLAVPDSAGIPEAVRDDILVAPFNDPQVATEIMNEYSDQIARLAYGGAQELYGVVPDLCTLGKIIGGGLPLAAIAGEKEIMNHFDKNIVGEEKFTFQIGTLSGNPLAAVAGLKTMEILRRDGAYNRIRENGQFLIDSITKHLKSNNIEFQIVGDPTLFDIIFSETPVINYRDTKKNKAEYSKTFNQIVRELGILKADAKLYTHLALTEEDLQKTDSAFKKAAEGIAAIS